MARGFETRRYRTLLRSMVSMTRSGRRVEVFVVPSSWRGEDVTQLDNLATASESLLRREGARAKIIDQVPPAAAIVSVAVRAMSKPPAKLAPSELGSRLSV